MASEGVCVWKSLETFPQVHTSWGIQKFLFCFNISTFVCGFISSGRALSAVLVLTNITNVKSWKVKNCKSFFQDVSCHPFWQIICRAVKVSALIYAINVAAINAIKYFNAVNATLFTSGVRCPDTKPLRANVASPLHRRHGASSLIGNFIKVNTNMSHFLFLTLTLQQPPRLLHSPSSFTTDPPTNQPMRACYPTQPHPIGLELSHVPPRPVHWPSGHLSTYLITL